MTVKLYGPAVNGYPVITPVVPLKVSPAGKDPAVIKYAYGVVPPEATTVSFTSTPTTIGARLAGLMLTGGLIIQV